jgi:hypothetical protein
MREYNPDGLRGRKRAEADAHDFLAVHTCSWRSKVLQ